MAEIDNMSSRSTRDDQVHHNLSTVTPIVLQLNPVYATLEVLIALGAVIGNGLVILAFFKDRRLHKTTNYYILSLAVADFLVGCPGIPFAIMAEVGAPSQREACLFTLSVLMGMCTTSVFNLLGACLDRYLAIIYPFTYRSISSQMVGRVIISCWLAGILVGFLPLLAWNRWDEDNPQCTFAVMKYEYLWFMNFAIYIIPMPLIVFSYIHIFIVVRRQSTAIATNFTTNACRSHDLAAEKREQKVAKKISVVVFFFIATWTPMHAIMTVKAICGSCCIPIVLTNFAIIISHVVNPLIYAFGLRDIRVAIKNIFPCGLTGAQTQNISNVTTTTT